MSDVPQPMPHVMATYGRLPFALTHGRGVRCWDDRGREYLDALAGIAVNTLGHAHPKLVPALQDQVAKLIHCSNYYQNPLQEALAASLVAKSGLTNAFFCNSGLEANEAAIKIARRHAVNKGIAAPEIVVFDGAFHGRSLATMAATANPKVREGFGPSVPGFVRAPFNDIPALEALAASNPHICAVFFETIQGEGGVNPARIEFLQAVRALCDRQGWLLMLDEVQSGIGRTGKWFAHQWAGIQPDVMPLAKGLGSGVPIGAVVCGPKAANVLQAGMHGTTFGGNPLAMRAGVETLRIMEEEDLLGNATRVGEHLMKRLRDGLEGVAGVTDIRGQGLMIGIELDRSAGAVFTQAAEAGLLISVTQDKVIRLVPALILTQAEADELADRLLPIIQAFLAQA